MNTKSGWKSPGVIGGVVLALALSTWVVVSAAPTQRRNAGRADMLSGRDQVAGGIRQEQSVGVPIAVDYRIDPAPISVRAGRTSIGAGVLGRERAGQGGVAAAATCLDDLECTDCNACTEDLCPAPLPGTCTNNPFPGGSHPGCDDGLFCNGVETCDGAGNCTNAPDVDCGAGNVCVEGAGVADCVPTCPAPNDCNDNLDCTDDACDAGTGQCIHTNACGPGATCSESQTGKVCGEGRCCVGTTCSSATLADCDTAGGVWLATVQACATLESGTPNVCPSYGSGIAPQGTFTAVLGPVSNLSCDSLNSIGDDYTVDIAGGWFDLQILRFSGNTLVAHDTRYAIEFWDTSGPTPILIEDVFWPDGINDFHATQTDIKVVDFDPPLTLPTTGVVVWRTQPNFGPHSRFEIFATDAVDVGSNDADSMWVNGTIIGATDAGPLPAGQRVLAFEMVGTAANEPLGACCTGLAGVCSQDKKWTCENTNGIFQEVGIKCSACSNDLFAACTIDDDCKKCFGGTNAGNACMVNADCTDGTCTNQHCVSGANADEPCLLDTDCIAGTCTGTATCETILPACVLSSCCNPTTGDCVDSAFGSAAAAGAAESFAAFCAGKVCRNDPFTSCTTDADCGGAVGSCVDVSTYSFQGFGTSCDPNCCLQPAPTGGDTCAAVTLHTITVPALGDPPVQITITGNNSQATFAGFPDFCDSFAPESECPPWWEGFRLTGAADCADVRLDLCCSDISGEPVRPGYGSLWKNCAPCGPTLGNAGVQPPIGVGKGTAGFARGGPFCNEDNLWMTWGPIRNGDYYYPIYSCPDGTAVVPPGADYQMHVTVGACEESACCLPDADSTCIGPGTCPGGVCTANLCVGGPRGDVGTCDLGTNTCTGDATRSCTMDAHCGPLQCTTTHGMGCATNDDCAPLKEDKICVGDSNRPNELCCPGGACNNDPQNPVCVGGSRDTLPCCDGGGDCKGNCATGCLVLNEIACADAGGYWNGSGNVPNQSVASCDFGVCETGSCCLGPGICQDWNNPACDPLVPDDPNCCQPDGTNCLTVKDCRLIDGVYVGGPECDFPGVPCPTCEIQDAANCQLPDLSQFALVMMSDQFHADGVGVTTADDFVPLTDTISRVCTWGVYTDPVDCASDGTGPGCDCSDDVTDRFTVTVFNDAGGFPGTVVGSSTVATLNRSAVRSSFVNTYEDAQMYEYQLALDTPIGGTGVIIPGTKYWIEIANNTTESDTCNWHWAQSAIEFNNYSAIGSTLGYVSGAGRLTDMSFCVDVNLDVVPIVEAACCTCSDGSPPNDCTVKQLADCIARRWDVTEPSCAAVVCDDTIPNDSFLNPTLIEGDVSLSIDTACSDSDGPREGGLNFGGDVWYNYTVGCTGKVLVSMCGTGNADNAFDSVIGVYKDSNDSTHCPIPTDAGWSPLGVPILKDEACSAVADGGAGFIITSPAKPGDCFTVRVGGFGGARGRAALVVSCQPALCPPSQPPTLQVQFGTGLAGAAEPKNRFLPIKAGDAGQSQTIRVVWDAMANWPGGHTTLVGQKKYLQQPFQVCENSGNGLATAPPNCGPSPGQPQKWFWAARLTCSSAAAWYGNIAGLTQYCTGSGEACSIDADCAAGTCGVDGVLHIVDDGIVASKKNPSQPSTYTVQVVDSRCLIDQEGSFSIPLVVTNPIFGDAGGTPGTCPYSPPNGDTTLIGDVTEAINKFSNLACAPKKTRVDVEPVTQDFKVNFTDVLNILSGFQGQPYSFAAPLACPVAAKVASSPRVRR